MIGISKVRNGLGFVHEYEGELNADNKPNGHGEATLINKYIGSFIEGTMEGCGRYLSGV